MSESLIVYKSIRLYLILTLLLSLIFLIGGFFIAQLAMPITEFNLFVVLVVYAGFPIIAMFLGFYIGWRAKTNSVVYNPPEWDYQPLGLTPDEYSRRIRDHNNNNFRIVAYSNYWLFFLPPILSMLAIGLPFYSFYEDSSIQNLLPLSFAIILLLIYSLSEYGGFRASYNAASSDFTVCLIREAIELAKTQSKIAGISKIHVVLDHASFGDYHVYRNPRVVARVSGIEKEAYIESNTEDIGAIDRLLVRLYLTSGSDQIVWWWQGRDRNFRKYAGDDEYGYYIQSPIPSPNTELGVKDVKLVTQNAVAILLLEWMKISGRNAEFEDILTKLGANQA